MHNCFTYNNFNVPENELSEFKHIVLTGKNGSGKTTILNRIATLLGNAQGGKTKQQTIKHLNATIAANKNHQSRNVWEQQISSLNDIDLKHLGGSDLLINENGDFIISFFKAHRKVDLKEVKTVSKEDEFIQNIRKQNNTDDFIGLFKQYLVNKKVYEAFDFMKSETGKIKESKKFFDDLTAILRSIFEDDQLELDFVQENFEFYLKLKDSRRITFNQLSEGFSAFLSILMDLLMRTDLLRKAKNDYTIEPEGIVIIDEPETHFHLSMQYQVLPLISSLFPKLQLIIATHSPAIISSIKNAIIFDLTSKDEVSGWVLGSSYSELMIKHFGLDNEYSPTADQIILNINNAVREKDSQKLKKIISDNESYLTPSLRLEIESQIIHIDSAKKA